MLTGPNYIKHHSLLQHRLYSNCTSGLCSGLKVPQCDLHLQKCSHYCIHRISISLPGSVYPTLHEKAFWNYIDCPQFGSFWHFKRNDCSASISYFFPIVAIVYFSKTPKVVTNFDLTNESTFSK